MKKEKEMDNFFKKERKKERKKEVNWNEERKGNGQFF